MYAESSFGRWLRQRRRHLDLTQADLAERVGCSEITIRKIEADDRTPSRQVAELLAACLEVPTAERSEFVAFARSVPRADPPAAPPVPIAYAGPLAPLTRLLGRDADTAQVERRLLGAQVRLLTLAGPPGIGKTRLSMHVAERVRPRFSDGVRFVALAPVRDPALVIPALVQALGVTQRAGQTPAAALSAALGAQQLLLVLDNFEQVAAAAPQVAELLRAAPRVKGLVTSRATLNVSGEHLYAVPPLALPDPCALPPLDDLTCYPSIQLFVERVRAVRPDFMLTAENAPIVAEICARLDGLPLAIELAAARSKLFAPEALRERLRRPAGSGALSVLVNGPHDLLAHQRTLRGTLDWSYELLSHDEQAVLMRLAVFAGGCDIEAAEAIASEGKRQKAKGKTEDATSVLPFAFCLLPLLESLLDKSLVRQAAGPDGEPRFTLLETIREYALDRLAACGGLAAARRRHATYYAALARAAAPRLRGAEQQRWLQRLHADYHNLRAALEWLVDHDPEAGLRCAADLCQFWHMRSLLGEGRDWLASLLARCQADTCRAARAQALCAAGFLAYQQGDHPLAEQLSAESLALHRALGDRQGAAAALMNLGSIAFCRADYPQAIAIYDESLALCRALGDTGGIAHALRNLALIAKDQGDLDRATLLLEESLALYRQTGDTYGVGRALFNLSTVAYWQGDYPRSGALAEQTAAICRELGDQMVLAYALDGIGMAAYKQGDLARAQQHLEESLRLLRALDEKAGIALALHEMGLIACAQGNPARAAQLLCEGLALAWGIGDRRRAAFCLEGLAAAWARRPLDAARLLGAAAALREALGAPLPLAERPDYERTLTAARAGAGPAAFAAAWEAGQMMPIDHIIGETLDVSR